MMQTLLKLIIKKYKSLKSNGFTIIEILTTVVIVGVLATLVVPRVLFTSEKARAAEAISFLQVMRSSQLTFRLETGNYTGDIGNIDATFPAFSNFQNGTPINCELTDETNFFAEVERNGNLYWLKINSLGDLCCEDTIVGSCNDAGFSDDCPPGDCAAP